MNSCKRNQKTVKKRVIRTYAGVIQALASRGGAENMIDSYTKHGGKPLMLVLAHIINSVQICFHFYIM